MSSEETEWELLEKRIKHKEEWDKEHNKPKDQTCPKCGVELAWYSGSNMEWEIWHCAYCSIEYKVDIELVRFWDTLKEID